MVFPGYDYYTLNQNIHGTSAIRPRSKNMSQHIIDCDAEPFCPDDLEVVEHRKHGQLQWDPDRIRLEPFGHRGSYLDHGKIEVFKTLDGLPIVNANVLDYLLKHPELVPDDWYDVYFWGTLYRSLRSGLGYVRCLCRSRSEWERSGVLYLDDKFFGVRYAAVLVA